MRNVIVGVVCLFGLSALAQAPEGAEAAPANAESTEAASAPAQPAEASGAPEKKQHWSEKVTFEALVDSNFSYQVGSPLRSANLFRAFDVQNGTLALNYAELAVGMAADPVGFRIDFGFGQVADMTAEVVDLTPGDPTDAAVGPNGIFKNVQQAYASVKLPGTDSVVVDFGKFVTNAGGEVIEAKNNWLYTRSILFWYAIPIAHTGVRVGGQVAEGLTLQASLVNGWEYNLDIDEHKTLGLSAFYTAPSGTFLAVNLYSGPEVAGDPNWRFVGDLVVTHPLTDKLSLGLNADYGFQGTSKWYGAALMGKLSVNEHLNLALRGEYFSDPDGFRTAVAGLNLMEVTVGAGIPIGANAEFRVEARHDIGSQTVFLRNGAPANGQTTATVAALAWF